MVILRATHKVLKLLPSVSTEPLNSDTALGDWYVKQFVVDRRPLLLLVSERSLLPILIPARKVRSVPDRLPELVADRLERGAVPRELIDSEVAAMTPVRVAKTVDRSVLGVLVDFAKLVPYYLEVGSWGEADLRRAESLLAETPCYASRPHDEVVFPVKDTPEILSACWGAG